MTCLYRTALGQVLSGNVFREGKGRGFAMYLADHDCNILLVK